MKQKKPKESQIMICKQCGNKTSLTNEFYFAEETVAYSGDGDPHIFETYYMVLLCPSCNRHSLIYTIEFNDDSDDWKTWDSIYPKEITYPQYIPQDILKLVKEADRIKYISPEAYVILIRKVLELICLKFNAKGKTLYNKLQNLSSRQTLPPTVSDISGLLKDIGNIGAHADNKISEQYIYAVSDFIEFIIHYLFTVPERIKMLRKAFKKNN